MKAKNKYLLSSSVVLCVVATTMALGFHPKSDEQPVQFITNFYKDYLSQPGMKRTDNLPAGTFYSKGADALIATNDHLCGTLSRGDEICGYGADADMILNAQEIDPNLNFEKARFKAIASGKATVDVFFNVYPELGEPYDRTIRYVLAKEKAGWRVDDVFFDDGGGFPVNRSMRSEINQENEAILYRAREIAHVAGWVFLYLRNGDMLDRAERFVTIPVQVCSESGSCRTVQKGDEGLRQTMAALHRAYYRESDDTTDLSGFLPNEGLAGAVEGKVITVDALDFTFQNKGWWITKIDLGRLGRTIPLQRQREPLQ
jgi:hypothetical protein